MNSQTSRSLLVVQKLHSLRWAHRPSFPLTVLFLVGLWLGVPIANAQAQPVGQMTVGSNVRVSPDNLGLPLTEPHLAAHPKNPKHLLAAAILAAVTAEGSRNEQPCVSFFSEDAGLNWSAPHKFDIPSCADPWVALREDGVALFVGLGRGQLYVFRSEDSGRHWAAVPLPAGFGRAHDRPTLAVDTSPGPFAGSFYLLSILGARSATRQNIVRVHLARSTDRGKTFEEPLQVQPSNLNLNVFTQAILSDGTLLVSFADFQSNVDDFRDKGLLERGRMWVMASTDGGKALSSPLFAAEGCGGDIAADTSAGPFRDRVYLQCTKRGAEGVWILGSVNKGERWLELGRANAKEGDVLRKTRSIAVSNNGVLGVSWYERAKGSQCQHIYFAASLDGGKTFLPEVQVSTAESCPKTPRNGRAAERWEFGGDYSGLATAADGTFHVLWADSRSGIYQLYTATVKVTGEVKPQP